MTSASYEASGVKGQRDALASIRRLLTPTFDFVRDGEVITPFGHYASVVKVSDELGIAVCIDGVGSKTLVASALERYDTIGFDCVAMNVNDILCLGARPLALVDYLAVNALDSARSEEILRGLAAAAREAGIAIAGGEIAQLPEIIGASGPGLENRTSFDLAGACIGTVHPQRVLLGEEIRPGDALIGLHSSGIHANGLTLARRALLGDGGYRFDDELPTLGRTLGEELLQPTLIYAAAVTRLWDAGIDTRGLAHITGDGLANLCRLAASVGYVIEELPERLPIFELIQEVGGIPDAEMLRVFNMGVGFVVVVPTHQQEAALKAVQDRGFRAQRLGHVSDEHGILRVVPLGLVGSLDGGEAHFRAA